MIKLVGESLKQYDLNRQIEIFPTGMVLEVKFLNRSPNSFEVPFTEKDGRVYAEVPSILLKTFGVITVETLEILDDGSQIEQRMTFTVDKAKKPEGYECPKPEILTPNYLKNNSTGELPFGETTVMGDTLTWDGNTDGLEFVDAGEGMVIYKISDAVPSFEDLQQGGTLVVAGETTEISSDTVIPMGETLYAFGGNPSLGMGVTQDNADLMGIPVSKKGFYIFVDPSISYTDYSLTVNNYTGFEATKVKTIDPKYLPVEYIKQLIAEVTS